MRLKEYASKIKVQAEKTRCKVRKKLEIDGTHRNKADGDSTSIKCRTVEAGGGYRPIPPPGVH